MSSLKHVNPRVKDIRASSHSELTKRAEQITQEITQGALRPFKEVIDVSSGDFHRTGMKPLTFVRQVLCVCLYPELLENKDLPLDVRQRAQRLLQICDGGSLGSYTASAGMWRVRQSISEFISRRDAGVPSYAKDVFISIGSQKALMTIVKLISSVEGQTRTGVLTAVPCPHTLPSLLDDAGVTLEPYLLMEDQGWAVDLEELHRALKVARGRCNPRAVYISNPGNPTGHVQDRKSIQEVIRFAAAERLLLLVNEVYQDSVFGEGGEFISYKKVLFEMGDEFSEGVELVSFHSLSNACMGECGLRAGYMEFINLDPGVEHFISVLLDTDISVPVTGQLALDLMVNPPTPGDPSHDSYTKEVLLTRAILSQNAQRAQKFLDDLPGMSCQPVMAGIYLFPRLHLPSGIIEQAEELKVEADVLYCQWLLEEQGVLLGAGSQNGEAAGNHHLRFCVLVPPETLEDLLSRLRSFHLRLLGAIYDSEKSVEDAAILTS
ncbi:alanine aminotransferase 1-like isoform X1 [Xyrichtys novacula]|uniref:alanine transaminase n=1 Tax=Xyrichtys novacula TaxID=13765 RepID=A0AAV1FIE2_XYRNO|nr:alanine aminotransferase 1-like isoform X1 [Xyrichtys novacula]